MENESDAALFAAVGAGLADGAFEPAYQPIMRLPGRGLFGFEALARWRRPGAGLLTPGAFLPALEDPTLEARISEAIAWRVLEDAAKLRAAGLEFGRLSINLADRQIDDGGYADRLLARAGELGLGGADLMIEVRETSSLDGGRRFDALLRLAAAGAVVALDDFGVGHANLTHLRLPFLRALKLDLSLTQGLRSDRAARAIVTRCVDLCADLGLELVAEGVEDAPTEAALIEIGCPAAQGYFYARPAPLDAIEAQLRRGGWSDPSQV